MCKYPMDNATIADKRESPLIIGYSHDEVWPFLIFWWT